MSDSIHTGLNIEGVAPNETTMKAAAKVLGIKMPRGRAKPVTIVKALREGFAKRLEGIPEDDWIKCPVCGEVTDDDDAIEVCPFCGDEGADEPAAATADDKPIEADKVDEAAGEEPADAEEPPTANLDDDVEEEPEEDPAVAADAEEPGTDLATGSEVMLAALETEKKIIRLAQTNMVGAGYELGMAIGRIREGNLWKAEGHRTFRKFCESMGVSHTLAYSLVDMTKKFDKDTFLEVGRKKLMIVARADAEDQDEVLNDARDGASVRELEAKERERKEREAGDKPDKPTDPAAGKPGRPSREDQTITLLTKVGGRAMVHPFRNRTSQTELEKWEKDSYAQVQLSDDVFLLIALKTNKEGEPVSVMATFRRATTTDAVPAPAATADAAE